MDLNLLIGAGMLSGFLAGNVYCCYVYLRRRISLDPRSPVNHAIARRFDSELELTTFHQSNDASVLARANQALGVWGQRFQAFLDDKDPDLARLYRAPTGAFQDVTEIARLARGRGAVVSTAPEGPIATAPDRLQVH
jgi:hypothetical protein